MNQIKADRPVLEVNQLKVDFACKDHLVHAVKGVSLKVMPGKITALVGESGSGKSVTAMAIMNLLDPPGVIAEGQVILSGQDFLQLSPRQQRKILGKQVGVVFQDPFESLNPRIKIGSLLIETICTNQKVSKKQAEEIAVDLLIKVKLRHVRKVMKEYSHQLSGGMCQRVMIAMAMAQKPALLIADEPTTALDVMVQGRILEEILQLKENHNTGILFITHDLGVVAEVADDVYIMRQGKIIEEGDVFQVFDQPRHPYTKELIQSILAV
ncbi:ABC transporter ATP-binding protein [Aminipila butyrica]|uniref:Nickel import system ATP-binding protein NikD n=1 Tax=Aminipila butyrica TaxID=433296 RepID=A0A858BTH5_9FIRM|nr:ABC transporter ATP-binding protein [Aminipila butyrica]QIB68074.1 ABC transporter ATP-binding protein [Aminipila butyrica]